MNKDALKKIDTKTDGKNAERFGTLLKKVVNVPKADLQEQEKQAKAKRSEVKGSHDR